MEIRTQSRDELGRFYTRVRCTQCEMLSINGVPCHETGCPDAWIGRRTPCWGCGCDFVPETRPNRYSACPDCADGASVDDTCDDCGERHCPACSPCEEA